MRRVIQEKNKINYETGQRTSIEASQWLDLSKLKVFGLRRSALLEVTLFLVSALALDHLFLESTRFWDWSPHPFWIIVILVSCQYGTNEGLMAAALTSLALLAGNLPEQTLSQDVYDYLFGVAKRPLMWSTTSVILGGLRIRQIEERNLLKNKLEESRHREKTTANAYEKLRSLKRKLESRLAGQVQTATTLYQAVTSIEKLQPEEVLRGVVDVMRTLLQPNKFSLFLLEDDRLELSIADGWESSDPFSRSLNPEHPLFGRIVAERKLACIAREGDESLLRHEGVLAGPLIDPGSGELLGMLKIEDLGFVELNMTSLQTFRIISEWLATTYKNAQTHDYIRSQAMTSEKTQLFSYGFFIGHKDFFVELAKRMGFQLSMILVRLENEEALDDLLIQKVSGILKKVVGGTLRKTDLAFDHGQTGKEFAVLLPGASVEDAGKVSEKLAGKLNQALRELDEFVDFSYSIHALFKENRKRALLTRENFEARLDFLLRLQTREEIPILLAAFELEEFERLESDVRIRVSGQFRKSMERFLRDHGELCFAYQRSDSLITMVLPSETHESAHQKAEDFRKLFQNETESVVVRLKHTLHLISPPEKASLLHVQQNWNEAERVFSVPQ